MRLNCTTLSAAARADAERTLRAGRLMRRHSANAVSEVALLLVARHAHSTRWPPPALVVDVARAVAGGAVGQAFGMADLLLSHGFSHSVMWASSF